MGKKKNQNNSAFWIANDPWDKASFGELEASIVPAQHPLSALGLSRALAAPELECSCLVP